MDSQIGKGTGQKSETGGEVLKVRLSLMGRPLKVCTFQKDVVTVGRDPESDIYLDNPGISRHHLRLEKTAAGYYAEDLESANGTFLNDEPIRKALLRNEDVLRVGKFSLWIAYESDRRSSSADSKAVSPTTFQGTTVLSSAELDDMMARARQRDTAPGEEPVVAPTPVRQPSGASSAQVFGVALFSFVLGIAVGVAATWIFVH